jgi:two-component system LytT family response regulator
VFVGLSAGLSEIDSLALRPLQGQPIRVMLAEPDAVSRRLIHSVLQDEPDVALDPVDQTALIASMHERSPDVVILDMHTPVVQRVESWEAVGVPPPPVTIVTAYDAGSVSLFASRATGVLVKPIGIEDLHSTLNVARSRIARIRTRAHGRPVAVEPQAVLPTVQLISRLAVESGDKIVLVRTSDIEWILSCGNQVRLHVGNTSYLLRQSMKRLHAMLDPTRFLRVHRNAIINLDYVEEFNLPAIGNMFVKLRNGFCLPLRKSTRPMLRKLLMTPLQLTPHSLV